MLQTHSNICDQQCLIMPPTNGVEPCLAVVEAKTLLGLRFMYSPLSMLTYATKEIAQRSYTILIHINKLLEIYNRSDVHTKNRYSICTLK